MSDEVRVEARGVSWWVGDCVAVRRASIALRAGRLHALVGENGAGKSTLLKALAGAIEVTEGEVRIDGQRLSPPTPAEAIRRGVGLVYQHFALVASFTGLENLMLGAEPAGPGGWLRPAELRQRAGSLARETGLEVPLDVPVERLSVGQRQRLEIVRVLLRGARVVLLDEPTAVLTPGEADGLYALLRRLASQGTAIAVVTHHLDEVQRFADEVTVLRRGQVVSSGPTAGVTVAELSARALGAIAPVEPPAPIAGEAPVVIDVHDLHTEGESVPVHGVSLTVRQGEVVGVAGIDGNGQEALVEALAGLHPAARGRMTLAGVDLTGAGVRERRCAGLEVVHGDRHRFGLINAASLHDNLLLGDSPSDDVAAARRLTDSGAVPAAPEREASALSGGNQQKLVMARALDRTPRAMVVAYPTRGVDAAAAAQIRRRLVEAAAGGAAIVLVSGDWDELRAIAHRLVVLGKGRVVAELPSDVSPDKLGEALLAGASGASEPTGAPLPTKGSS